MIKLIIESIYFMLPAYFANMAPVIFKNYFRFLKVPVDFNKRLFGKPIFGKHKTWHGIIFATLIGLFVFYIQKLLYNLSIFQKISLFNYFEQTIFLGFLLGFGAIFGDLIKSFFKRRINKKPGERWLPFDQLDFVAGALIFSSIVFIPSWQIIISVFILTFFGHILIRHVGYWLGITKEKW